MRAMKSFMNETMHDVQAGNESGRLFAVAIMVSAIAAILQQAL
jgi:hypothetical protein